ncbi:MAG: hypothetical protein H6657_00040 [Ardenticatenaceae bacterium]|nr:hypothetical protein [Ardenticatenaceae bacterium]
MKRRFILLGLLSLSVAVWFFAGQILVRADGLNPTPVVIALTPTGTPVGEFVTPTLPGGPLPDRFEPNDTADTAQPIGFTVETALTLIGGDVDFFTGYLKAGQMVVVETAVADGVDTHLALYWQGELRVENDDRSLLEVSSQLDFTAPAEGWYVLAVRKATHLDGEYELSVSLAMPSPTATMLPTATPTPSPTPLLPPDAAEPNNQPEAAKPLTAGSQATYTLGEGDIDYFSFLAKAGRRYSCETTTDTVDTLLTVSDMGLDSGAPILAENDDRAPGRIDSFTTWISAIEVNTLIRVQARGGGIGSYTLLCQENTSPVAQPGNGAASPVTVNPTATPVSTPFATTSPMSLTWTYLGEVMPQEVLPQTRIRLLIYYDANNDRQPGPGEGVANVSVLAVDAQGQRLAQVFTNLQGEVIFELATEQVAQLIVPFVPGWSARVRAGELNNDIVLGLPAVRLPIFLPVQAQTSVEE